MLYNNNFLKIISLNLPRLSHLEKPYIRTNKDNPNERYFQLGPIQKNVRNHCSSNLKPKIESTLKKFLEPAMFCHLAVLI